MLRLYSTNTISRVAKAALPPRNICVTSSQTCHSCTWSKHLLPVLINKRFHSSTCSFIPSLSSLSDHLQLPALPLHSTPSLPEECAHCARPSISLVIGRSGAVGEDCVGLGSFPCSDYPGLLGGNRPLPSRPSPPPSSAFSSSSSSSTSSVFSYLFPLQSVPLLDPSTSLPVYMMHTSAVCRGVNARTH